MILIQNIATWKSCITVGTAQINILKCIILAEMFHKGDIWAVNICMAFMEAAYVFLKIFKSQP